MKRIRVELEGICPIMFNRLLDTDLSPDAPKGKKTREEYIAEAKQRIYMKDDIMGVPAVSVKKNMREGCKSAGIKLGKKSAEPLMRALVHFETDFVPFTNRTTFDGIHETTARRPPRTGGRVQVWWPYCNEKWKVAFNLYIVDDRIRPTMVEKAFHEGGLAIGLCEHRPEYGRYKVTGFAEI